MKVNAAKLELIEWISKIQDESILKNLLNIKDSSEFSDWWDELSEDQIAEIEKGESDHNMGNVLTSLEFWSKYGGQVKESSSVKAINGV